MFVPEMNVLLPRNTLFACLWTETKIHWGGKQTKKCRLKVKNDHRSK